MSNANSILFDIQEVYQEVGTSFDFVQPTSPPTNVYKESRKKTYATPIPLIGMITFNPSPEELTEIGVKQQVSVIFKVAYQTLIDKGIATIDEADVLKSSIKYKDKYYDIKNFIPRSLYQGDFLIYNFECIRG